MVRRPIIVVALIGLVLANRVAATLTSGPPAVRLRCSALAYHSTCGMLAP